MGRRSQGEGESDMIQWQDRHMSAMALSTYQSCALRFRYRYLDNLYWSRAWGATDEDRKALELGQNFHLMARRFYAGVDPAQVADPIDQKQLEHWLGLLQGYNPRTFDRQYYPELDLRLNRSGLKLMAKFDLVVVQPDGRAIIFDWKTEKRMPKREYLKKSMQTLIYRYMLCAAGGSYSPNGQFKPSDVTMIYWNPSFYTRPIELPYSDAQFAKDELYLQNLIAHILRTPRELFLATTQLSTCQRCEFNMLCHGRRAEQLDRDDEETLFEDTLTWDTLPDLP
jgi:hypothetical protein